ncbi:MAG: TIGR02679 family protein [Acidobacteriota bacterium]
MNDEALLFLSRPGLRRLWPEVRDRLERLGGARGTVRLEGLEEDERRALADLLGLPTLPEGELRVPLDRLDRALRESRFGIDLRTAMEILDGPLRDLPGEREQERVRWAALWEKAEAHPVLAVWPALRAWLADLRTTGLLRRLGPGREDLLLEQALAVLLFLSRRPDGIRLPVLANEVLGTSHGLDPGRPVATLVLRGLAAVADRPPPRSSAERRDLWNRAGVVENDLSCDVLTLGLAPLEGGLIGEGVRRFAEAGEPVRLTLRQLVGWDFILPSAPRVYVCENPVVVAAAADRLGAACPPLVCTGGYPNHAVLTLLGKLARRSGILYHGDFDWDGLRIANRILEAIPFQPWRFTAAEYRAAPKEGYELRTRPVEAAWDPELAPAMAEAGVAVEEEAVLGELLGDLACP